MKSERNDGVTRKLKLKPRTELRPMNSWSIAGRDQNGGLPCSRRGTKRHDDDYWVEMVSFAAFNCISPFLAFLLVVSLFLSGNSSYLWFSSFSTWSRYYTNVLIYKFSYLHPVLPLPFLILLCLYTDLEIRNQGWYKQ